MHNNRPVDGRSILGKSRDRYASCGWQRGLCARWIHRSYLARESSTVEHVINCSILSKRWLKGCAPIVDTSANRIWPTVLITGRVKRCLRGGCLPAFQQPVICQTEPCQRYFPWSMWMGSWHRFPLSFVRNNCSIGNQHRELRTYFHLGRGMAKIMNLPNNLLC